MRFTKHVLENGLRAVCIPQDRETVTVMVLFGAGSRYETEETNGMAHALEHMFFKGSKKFPTALDISKAIESVGGVTNAFTGSEEAGYYITVPSSKVLLAIEILADMLMHPLLDAEELEKEKGPILQELARKYDDPDNFIGDLWEETLYGNQPIGRPVIGTKETIVSFTREKLFEYLGRVYVPKNAVIVVAGGFDQPSVLTRIQELFRDMREGDLPEKGPATEESRTGPKVSLKSKRTKQAHFAIGFYGCHLFHPKRFPLQAVAGILGAGMSSRLFTEVRERRGLAYHISAHSLELTDTGFLVSFGGVDPSHIDETLRVVLGEFKKIGAVLEQQELKDTVEYLKGTLALSVESSRGAASFIGLQELLTGNIRVPSELFNSLDAVSVGDTLEAAHTFIVPSSLHLALIGPFKGEQERFRALLREFE